MKTKIPKPTLLSCFPKRTWSQNLALAITFLVAFAYVAALSAQTSLSVGEVSFLAAESDSNGAIADGVTIVPWVNLAPGTVLKFTDNGLENTGGTSINNTEHAWTFTVGAATINAGTVLKFSYASPTAGKWNGPASGAVSADLGGTGATINAGISTSGDQFFVYQGSGATANIATGDPATFSGTLVSGINIGNILTTGNADSNGTYVPTSLVNGNAWVNGGNIDNAYYSGTRSGLTNTLYRAAMNGVTNYTLSNTVNASYDHTTSYAIGTTATIHWDANGNTAGNGGAGTWDATTADRFKNGASGTTFLRWVNSTAGNDHTAVFGGTAGTVTVAGGGVTASGIQFLTDSYTLSGGAITLTGSAPSLDAASNVSATVSSVILGSSGLTKTGDGTVRLSGANSYSGTTAVSAGSLLVNGNQTGATGNVTVAANSTLGGNGTVAGATSVSGTVSPGDSAVNGGIGTLTFTSTMGFGGTGKLVFTLVSPTSHDQIKNTSANALTLDPNLVVEVNIASYAAGAQAGDLFRLIDWTGAINPNGFDPAEDIDVLGGALGGGLAFDYSTFLSHGTIAVVAIPEPSRVSFMGFAMMGAVFGFGRFRKSRRL